MRSLRLFSGFRPSQVGVNVRGMAVLKNIPSVISPELLKVLADMGHGDELVLADANFPGKTCGGGRPVVRADAIGTPAMLKAILKLFPLDTFATPAAVMQRVDKPNEDAPIFAEFQKILNKAEGSDVKMERVERFAFYERAQKAFGIVQTGETALYGNIIIKKGVIGK